MKQDLEEVGRHIRELFWNQYVYERAKGIIRDNPQLAGSANYFLVWLERAYTDSVLITIRRLLDRDSQAVSLGTITNHLIRNPGFFTREKFTSGWRFPQQKQQASEAFTILAGPGDELNPALWEERLADTNEKCESVRKIVDKFIAHNDRKKPSSELKWTKVNEAIDAVGVLYLQLEYLINRIGSESLIQAIPAEVREKLTDLPGDPRWDRIFRIPWIPPRQE